MIYHHRRTARTKRFWALLMLTLADRASPSPLPPVLSSVQGNETRLVESSLPAHSTNANFGTVPPEWNRPDSGVRARPRIDYLIQATSAHFSESPIAFIGHKLLTQTVANRIAMLDPFEPIPSVDWKLLHIVYALKKPLEILLHLEQQFDAQRSDLKRRLDYLTDHTDYGLVDATGTIIGNLDPEDGPVPLSYTEGLNQIITDCPPTGLQAMAIDEPLRTIISMSDPSNLIRSLCTLSRKLGVSHGALAHRISYLRNHSKASTGNFTIDPGQLTGWGPPYQDRSPGSATDVTQSDLARDASDTASFPQTSSSGADLIGESVSPPIVHVGAHQELPLASRVQTGFNQARVGIVKPSFDPGPALLSRGWVIDQLKHDSSIDQELIPAIYDDVYRKQVLPRLSKALTGDAKMVRSALEARVIELTDQVESTQLDPQNLWQMKLLREYGQIQSIYGNQPIDLITRQPASNETIQWIDAQLGGGLLHPLTKEKYRRYAAISHLLQLPRRLLVRRLEFLKQQPAVTYPRLAPNNHLSVQSTKEQTGSDQNMSFGGPQNVSTLAAVSAIPPEQNPQISLVDRRAVDGSTNPMSQQITSQELGDVTTPHSARQITPRLPLDWSLLPAIYELNRRESILQKLAAQGQHSLRELNERLQLLLRSVDYGLKGPRMIDLVKPPVCSQFLGTGTINLTSDLPPTNERMERLDARLSKVCLQRSKSRYIDLAVISRKLGVTHGDLLHRITYLRQKAAEVDHLDPPPLVEAPSLVAFTPQPQLDFELLPAIYFPDARSAVIRRAALRDQIDLGSLEHRVDYLADHIDYGLGLRQIAAPTTQNKTRRSRHQRVDLGQGPYDLQSDAPPLTIGMHKVDAQLQLLLAIRSVPNRYRGLATMSRTLQVSHRVIAQRCAYLLAQKPKVLASMARQAENGKDLEPQVASFQDSAAQPSPAICKGTSPLDGKLLPILYEPSLRPRILKRLKKSGHASEDLEMRLQRLAESVDSAQEMTADQMHPAHLNNVESISTVDRYNELDLLKDCPPADDLGAEVDQSIRLIMDNQKRSTRIREFKLLARRLRLPHGHLAHRAHWLAEQTALSARLNAASELNAEPRPSARKSRVAGAKSGREPLIGCSVKRSRAFYEVVSDASAPPPPSISDENVWTPPQSIDELSALGQERLAWVASVGQQLRLIPSAQHSFRKNRHSLALDDPGTFSRKQDESTEPSAAAHLLLAINRGDGDQIRQLSGLFALAQVHGPIGRALHAAIDRNEIDAIRWILHALLPESGPALKRRRLETTIHPLGELAALRDVLAHPGPLGDSPFHHSLRMPNITAYLQLVRYLEMLPDAQIRDILLTTDAQGRSVFDLAIGHGLKFVTPLVFWLRQNDLHSVNSSLKLPLQALLKQIQDMRQGSLHNLQLKDPSLTDSTAQILALYLRREVDITLNASYLVESAVRFQRADQSALAEVIIRHLGYPNFRTSQAMDSR